VRADDHGESCKGLRAAPRTWLSLALILVVSAGCSKEDINYVRARLSQSLAPSREGYLEARGFVVRDRQGAIRINIGVDEDGTPIITLNGKDGRPHALIGASPEDGLVTIALTDQSHDARLLLQLGDDGSPSVKLIDENKTQRITLTTDTTGPRLRLSGSKGQGRAVLGVFPPADDAKGSTAGLLVANEMGVPVSFTTVAGDAMPDLDRKDRKADAATATEVSKGKDSAQMVAISGGPLFMGCNETVDTECWAEEKTGRTVEVGGFEIDKTEVTVDQYARCVSAGACSPSGLNNELCNWQRPGRESHPINCVTWHQAVAYCRWVGKRLPTDAEWEKAARGTDRRKYPWGNDGYDSGRDLANVGSLFGGTTPVGSFPAGASPSGALDMVGNVLEWTADSQEGGTYSNRGGSWRALPQNARISFRGMNAARFEDPGIGFRCAR